MSEPVIPERKHQETFKAAQQMALNVGRYVSNDGGNIWVDVAKVAAMLHPMLIQNSTLEAKVAEQAATIQNMAEANLAYYRSNCSLEVKVNQQAATIARLTGVIAAFVASLRDNKMNNFANLVQAAVDAALNKQAPR